MNSAPSIIVLTYGILSKFIYMNKILDFFNKISGLLIFLIFVIILVGHLHHRHHRGWMHDRPRAYQDSVNKK